MSDRHEPGTLIGIVRNPHAIADRGLFGLVCLACGHSWACVPRKVLHIAQPTILFVDPHCAASNSYIYTCRVNSNSRSSAVCARNCSAAKAKGWCEMNEKRSRGTGRIFQRGNVFWCQYYSHGQQISVSTGETNEKSAGKFLKRKLAEVETGTHV